MDRGPYAVTLVNDGAIPHDITFDDGTTVYAEAGETATGEVTIPAEGMAFICSIPGHEEAGMIGQVFVSGATAAVQDVDGGGDRPLDRTDRGAGTGDRPLDRTDRGAGTRIRP
jgi:hypothetical protein